MKEFYRVIPYGTADRNPTQAASFATRDEAERYADWLPNWIQPAQIITPDGTRIITERGARFYEKRRKSGDYREELFAVLCDSRHGNLCLPV
jgi:hypothetical protein